MHNYNYFLKSASSSGELLPFERFTLYTWIKKYKPKNLLEIGTGTGGSTQYISDAMFENGNGKIYSCDPVRSPSVEFLKLRPNVEFMPITSNTLIDNIISDKTIIDFIFFDGPEDPDIALNDIKTLEKYITNKTLFSMHDWHIGIRGYDSALSTKAYKIKGYIEQSHKWKLIDILYADKKNSNFDSMPYDSVGLCLYEYNN